MNILIKSNSKKILSLMICLAFTSTAMAIDEGAETSKIEIDNSVNDSTTLPDFLPDLPELTDVPSVSEINEDATEWADDQRSDVKARLNDWAHKMDGWFGTPDPNDPASANLRVVLDTRWEDDPIEGSDVTVKPRIRGKLKLPVLEKRLSVVIGDEDLDDEEITTKGSSRGSSRSDGNNRGKTFDRKQARDDNTSIALRWSKIEDALGIDADVGVRSGDDLYAKLTVDRDLYQKDQWQINSHNYYRYGTDSEHTLKGEVNVQYALDNSKFINNNVNIRYTHEDDDEETTWGNELRKIHNLGKNKTLSYGVSAYGDFENSEPSLNTYGPTISYRQPFWRDWLFVQTELNYFNDKSEDKDHFPSALLRLEALF